MLTPRTRQVVFNPVASGIDLTPEGEPVDTSFGAVLGAAFARDNVVGSLLAHQWSSTEIDSALTWDIIWNHIKGTRYEAYSDKFAAEVHNWGALAAMKRNIDLRVEHDRTLAAAGVWGGVASFGAGLVSPENLIPGGAIVRGVVDHDHLEIGVVALLLKAGEGLREDRLSVECRHDDAELGHGAGRLVRAGPGARPARSLPTGRRGNCHGRRPYPSRSRKRQRGDRSVAEPTLVDHRGRRRLHGLRGLDRSRGRRPRRTSTG